jgi:hypothetical protein
MLCGMIAREGFMIVASCLCGAVRLEVAAAPTRVTDCNCSACRRYGTLVAYYTADQVKVLAAPDATFAYARGERALEWHTCRTCGCTTHTVSTAEGRRLYPDFADRVAVNARMMPPEVLAGVPIRKFDGADTWKEIP